MTGIEKLPGFVLRDLWLDGSISDKDYKEEAARRVNIGLERDTLIRSLVVALTLLSGMSDPELMRWLANEALAKAKEVGYAP